MRGPLKRSVSVDTSESAVAGASLSASSQSRERGPSLQRQLSLPDYKSATSFNMSGHGLEVIQVNEDLIEEKAQQSRCKPFPKQAPGFFTCLLKTLWEKGEIARDE